MTKHVRKQHRRTKRGPRRVKRHTRAKHGGGEEEEWLFPPGPPPTPRTLADRGIEITTSETRSFDRDFPYSEKRFEKAKAETIRLNNATGDIFNDLPDADTPEEKTWINTRSNLPNMKDVDNLQNEIGTEWLMVNMLINETPWYPAEKRGAVPLSDPALDLRATEALKLKNQLRDMYTFISGLKKHIEKLESNRPVPEPPAPEPPVPEPPVPEPPAQALNDDKAAKQSMVEQAVANLNNLVRANSLFGMGRSKATKEEWALCFNESNSPKCRGDGEKSSRVGDMPIFLKAKADTTLTNFENARKEFLEVMTNLPQNGGTRKRGGRRRGGTRRRGGRRRGGTRILGGRRRGGTRRRGGRRR